MKITYNLKGEHRKHLVRAIAEELNAKATTAKRRASPTASENFKSAWTVRLRA